MPRPQKKRLLLVKGSFEHFGGGERDLINDGEYMCNSTLLAILGRTAAYTGKTLTWDQMKDSTMDLSPSVYEFGSAPLVEIPKPGTTKFS